MSIFEGYFTVQELVKRNPQLTVGGVRFWLAQRNMNGLQQSGAILSPQRKLFIHKGHLSLYLRQGLLSHPLLRDESNPGCALPEMSSVRSVAHLLSDLKAIVTYDLSARFKKYTIRSIPLQFHSHP